MKNKGLSGEYLNTVPYGYIVDPSNKKNWIVDPRQSAIFVAGIPLSMILLVVCSRISYEYLLLLLGMAYLSFPTYIILPSLSCFFSAVQSMSVVFFSVLECMK